MKQTTRIAIAGLLSAAGSVLTAFASEFSGEAPASPESAAAPEAPKTPRKKAAAAAAPAEDKPADPAPETPAEPEQKPTAPEVSNPKYEEHRALIAPLVQGTNSTAALRDKVKEIIKKHNPDNEPHSLKTLPTANHAVFEKDIAKLLSENVVEY